MILKIQELCQKFPCLERVRNADGHYEEIKPEESASLTEEQKKIYM